MTKESTVKHSIKCMFCGESNDVTYLGGVDWFCNQGCHYNYRQLTDHIRRSDIRSRR